MAGKHNFIWNSKYHLHIPTAHWPLFSHYLPISEFGPAWPQTPGEQVFLTRAKSCIDPVVISLRSIYANTWKTCLYCSETKSQANKDYLRNDPRQDAEWTYWKCCLRIRVKGNYIPRASSHSTITTTTRWCNKRKLFNQLAIGSYGFGQYGNGMCKSEMKYACLNQNNWLCTQLLHVTSHYNLQNSNDILL